MVVYAQPNETFDALAFSLSVGRYSRLTTNLMFAQREDDSVSHQISVQNWAGYASGNNSMMSILRVQVKIGGRNNPHTTKKKQIATYDPTN